MTYILDTSALLRYLDNRAGGVRVKSLIDDHVSGRWPILMSAIQWGELTGILVRRHGMERAEPVLNGVKRLNFEIVPATAERAERAASLRIESGLPYADAFAAELTSSTDDSVLVTADFDFRIVADIIKIEFLPANKSA